MFFPFLLALVFGAKMFCATTHVGSMSRKNGNSSSPSKFALLEMEDDAILQTFPNRVLATLSKDWNRFYEAYVFENLDKIVVLILKLPRDRSKEIDYAGLLMNFLKNIP